MAQLTVTLPLSDEDHKLLASLLNEQTEPSQPAAEAPKRTRRTKAEPKVAEPEETPAETVTEPADEEDVIGGSDDDDDEGPTLEDAVAKATALAADGKLAKVKAALAAVGAKRVSQLENDQIAAFLAELG